jgi:hypothetical protein
MYRCLDNTEKISSQPPVIQIPPTNLAVNALYAIANDIKTPSLTELQMLFGFGGKILVQFITNLFT